MRESSSRAAWLFLVLFVCVPVLSLFTGCKRTTPEEEKYIAAVTEQRKQKDKEMQTDPSSPLRKDSSVVMHNLKYFPVDPGFVFRSKLYRYASPDSIVTTGTKGEVRNVLRLGYLQFQKDGRTFRVNVYQGVSRAGIAYQSIWFTDRTTGKETYGVGRYIDFSVENDSSFVYTLDFNTAYNPYCAYSSLYSCAMPTKEDFLDLEIRAGELKFHE